MVTGPRKISRFIEDLVRPHVVKDTMYAAYQSMADQLTAVSKNRLVYLAGSVSVPEMEGVGQAITLQLTF